jgi:hypothetical protein
MRLKQRVQLGRDSVFSVAALLSLFKPHRHCLSFSTPSRARDSRLPLAFQRSNRRLQLSMEAHQDQQFTSSTTARPVQPPDAPAAALPTETLAQVFNLALEGLNSWDRQRARLELAQTCIQWYTAAEPGRELAVKDTQMAEAVAQSLDMQGAGAKVRSLSMEIEADGPERSKRATAHVSACPQLDSLELVAAGNLYLGAAGGRGCQFGNPLNQALRGLSPRTFSITSTREGTETPWLDSRELLE